MKRAGLELLTVMFVACSVVVSSAQAPQGREGGQGREGRGRGRGPAAPACTTLACDFQAEWDRSREMIINIADAMPDDKFSFKPTPAQRSFGEQVMHIVQVDTNFLATLGGKTPKPTINMQATSKADVMAALRQSMDWATAVIKEFNDQQLMERVMSVPFMGPMTSRLRILSFDLGHSQDIYGQMAVYLRLNGITPPASRRGGL